jgi:hypothetical protein
VRGRRSLFRRTSTGNRSTCISSTDLASNFLAGS